MRIQTIVFFLVMFLLPYIGITQINDCEDAVVVCDNQDLEFNPMGPGQNDFADPDNIEGCLVALEQNSAWYYFEIDPTAPPDLVLGFIIHPNGGLGEDYDWALYGPDVVCGNLGSPIRCSSSSAACGFCPETGMGMGALDVTEGPGTGDGFVMTLVVQPGQGFYLLIDNWLGTTNGFVLEWTDTAADYLNCEADPPCALEAQAGPDISACEGDDTFQLNGGSTGNHGNETYSWEGTDGGTAYLSDPTQQDPGVSLPPGFTGEIRYTLTVMEDTCISEDDMVLIVHPLPIVEIDSAGPFCPSDAVYTLTGTPSGGIWGGDATGNTFNPMTNGPGVHTVTYTYIDANGCTAMASMDITVYESPDVSIDPSPASFCESEMSVLLTASASGGAGNYMFNWSGPFGTGDQPAFNAISSGLHYVTVTDANGCTDSTSVVVTENLDPVIVINDPGPICGSIDFMTLTAAPSGGMFDGAIISPQGDILPSSLDTGTYQISYSFTDNNGCSSTEYLDIVITPIPEAIAGNSGPVCAGEQFTLSGIAVGEGTFIQYFWIGPGGYTSSEQNPTNATLAGAYIFQVVVDGCASAQDTTLVILHAQPEAIASNGGPYCNGETIQLSGSTTSSGNVVTYTWAGPGGYSSSAQNPIDATSAGLYSLVVTVDGCASLPDTTEVQFSTSPDASATNSGPYCEGDAIELFGSSMTQGTVITYSWDGPNGYTSVAQNPTDAVIPGQYYLVVEVDGCQSDLDSTLVEVHPLPQPMITGQQSFCTGFSSTLDAGPGYLDYLWNDSSTTQTLEVFISGTYSVTITDVNGCSGSTAFSVTENSALTPVISGTLEFCAGDTTTLNAGVGYAMYSWSNGLMTQTVEVTTGSNIGVTVTDASGCTGVATVTTTVHPNPNVTIGGSTTYCIGGFTVLDAGMFPMYEWSNDSTEQSIIVSAPGDYSVTVVNNNGCIGSDTVTVEESTSLNPVIAGGLAFCENGSTTLNAGTGFATYLWSDSSTAQTLLVSTAGTYSLSVSDGQGCTGTAEVSVIEVLPPSAMVETGTTLCNTVSGGSVINLYDLVTSGDMNGTWQDVDNSGASGLFSDLNFDGVTAGDYGFLYMTSSAVAPCAEATYTITITVLDCVCPEIDFIDAGPLCNDGDVLDLTSIVTTTETGTWSIIQTPPGGNSAALNGDFFDPTSSDTGLYVLQFSFSSAQPPGCPAEFDVAVQVDGAMEAGLETLPLEVCMGINQLINLADLITGEDPGGTWTETSVIPSQGGAFDASGGTFRTDGQVPATYRFEYAFSGTGACPDDESQVAVIVHPLPVVSIADNVVIDCANPIQILDASGSSTGPSYAMTWTGPGLVMDGSELTLNPNIDRAGNYTLVIENTATGCINSASVSVIANTDAPTGANLLVLDPRCAGDENGLVQINQVIGGAAPFVYTFNNGSPGNNVYFSDLSAGSYELIVEDGNGCKWDTVLTLLEPAMFDIEIGADLELGLGESGTVLAIVNLNANEIDTILWQPASIIECLTIPCLHVNVFPSGSTNLVATVIDTNGCEASDQLRVLVDRTRHVYIPNVFSPNGDGINDVFYIQGDESQIVQINQFRIFDRWGALLHKAGNFAPNDQDSGWDGQDKKDGINPGVFTYMAEIEFIDGVVEVYYGDVTLIR